MLPGLWIPLIRDSAQLQNIVVQQADRPEPLHQALFMANVPVCIAIATAQEARRIQEIQEVSPLILLLYGEVPFHPAAAVMEKEGHQAGRRMTADLQRQTVIPTTMLYNVKSATGLQLRQEIQ